MKSQSIQVFFAMVAISALMANCMPAGELTKEQKEYLSKESNWGSTSWNAHGYGSQSTQHTSQHSTGGSHPLNAQGLGYQSSEHSTSQNSGKHSNHDQITSAYYENRGHKH